MLKITICFIVKYLSIYQNIIIFEPIRTENTALLYKFN